MLGTIWDTFEMELDFIERLHRHAADLRFIADQRACSGYTGGASGLWRIADDIETAARELSHKEIRLVRRPFLARLVRHYRIYRGYLPVRKALRDAWRMANV